MIDNKKIEEHNFRTQQVEIKKDLLQQVPKFLQKRGKIDGFSI